MDPPYPTRSCQLLGRYLAIFHSPRFTSSNRMASRCMIWWKAGTWCTTSLINTRNWAYCFWENISVFLFEYCWWSIELTQTLNKVTFIHISVCLFKSWQNEMQLMVGDLCPRWSSQQMEDDEPQNWSILGSRSCLSHSWRLHFLDFRL